MKQYYTPEISDIRVGYECEYRVGEKYKWNKHIVENLHTDREGYGISELESYLKEGNLRTPYLTKEQIEAEGWERYKKNIGRLEYSIVFYKNTIEIYEMDETGYRVCKYNGNCPSINEFRTICKLLNIK